jgi:ATP-binding cassette subfamily B protein
MDADLILVLERGNLMQMGTHAELLQDTAGIYRRINDIQTRIDSEVELALGAST